MMHWMHDPGVYEAFRIGFIAMGTLVAVLLIPISIEAANAGEKWAQWLWSVVGIIVGLAFVSLFVIGIIVIIMHFFSPLPQ